jgi:hypothetical protein
MISPHFEEAVLLADRVGVIKDGRLDEGDVDGLTNQGPEY